MLSITRYRNTRYWALWENGQPLAVTVYKKGAVTLCGACNSCGRRA